MARLLGEPRTEIVRRLHPEERVGPSRVILVAARRLLREREVERRRALDELAHEARETELDCPTPADTGSP